MFFLGSFCLTRLACIDSVTFSLFFAHLYCIFIAFVRALDLHQIEASSKLTTLISSSATNLSSPSIGIISSSPPNTTSPSGLAIGPCTIASKMNEPGNFAVAGDASDHLVQLVLFDHVNKYIAGEFTFPWLTVCFAEWDGLFVLCSRTLGQSADVSPTNMVSINKYYFSYVSGFETTSKSVI
ncbi:unnamed protein product [Protopolystoma xenopodis]|uniref:Uncharacterized protein n=1 Tax=Protopolystoma xenopodis TaxID=117903 RepID=A0A448WTS9_9PLAT|nr:unnamed protein product [Protopolystoma xenopodis]